MQVWGIRNSKMLVTPLVLIQIFRKRMLVDWPKCRSDPRDEGHLACLGNPIHRWKWWIEDRARGDREGREE